MDPNSQQHIQNLVANNEPQGNPAQQFTQPQQQQPFNPPAPQNDPQPTQSPGQFTEPAPQQSAPQPVQQPQQPEQPPEWAQGLVEKVNSLEQQLAPQQTAPEPQQQDDDWQPRSFQDIDKRIQEKADQIADQKIQQIREQAEQQRREEEEAQREADQRIDQQLNQLQQAGYLPEVQNPVDQSDPGRQAQAELMAYAVNQGTNNLLAAAQSLNAHHQAGYHFDRNQDQLVRRGSQTQAAQAPIAGASPSVTGANNQQGPSMSDIASMSLDQLAARGSEQVGIGTGSNVQF